MSRVAWLSAEENRCKSVWAGIRLASMNYVLLDMY
jgi:hypothetical protein